MLYASVSGANGTTGSYSFSVGERLYSDQVFQPVEPANEEINESSGSSGGGCSFSNTTKTNFAVNMLIMVLPLGFLLLRRKKLA
jgi:hypothetical protein